MKVAENTEFKRSFFYEAANPRDLDCISDTILCYRGLDRAPDWTDIRSGKLKGIHTIWF